MMVKGKDIGFEFLSSRYKLDLWSSLSPFSGSNPQNMLYQGIKLK